MNDTRSSSGCDRRDMIDRKQDPDVREAWEQLKSFGRSMLKLLIACARWLARTTLDKTEDKDAVHK